MIHTKPSKKALAEALDAIAVNRGARRIETYKQEIRGALMSIISQLHTESKDYDGLLVMLAECRIGIERLQREDR